MESAERKGLLFRRELLSADRFKDAAIRLGSREVKTPLSRVSASLCSVTCRDQRRPFRARPLRRAPWRLRPAPLLDAVVFLAIAPPREKMITLAPYRPGAPHFPRRLAPPARRAK